MADQAPTARVEHRRSPRLAAPERKRAIVEAAIGVFSRSSYSTATTAEIARAAGVSEPILYRHFASKREIWLACLESAWDDARATLEHAGRGLVADDAPSPWRNATMPTLWLQGVMEAGDDAELRRNVQQHMRTVHSAIAGMLAAQQAAGQMPSDRDADAEAWIFVAGGLLRSLAERLGEVLNDDDLSAIRRERKRWLCGDA
jgi:AcrR family transcriptional regulator